MSAALSDRWLLKLDGDADTRLAALLPLLRGAPAYRALDADKVYVYLPAAADPNLLARLHPQGKLIGLQATLDLAGATAAADALFHYVVETDVLPEFDADLNAWYDEEHLPGLAAVPGTVRARRYTDAAGSPRYYACYDFAQREAFGSAPWLAVRGTAWSSRVR
ncbi:MAG: hypothetical protein Q8L92_15285, partial [Rubrivivax sp.]|nr:hypothetical protein [Rubrivivax sp.]